MMKLSLLATLAATANAQCRTSYTDATTVENCECNAACTKCIGAATDTALTALATACWKGECALATPFFTAKNKAVGEAAVVEPNLGTCGNAVCQPAVETISGAERTTVCVAPLIGTAADKIDYSAETIQGTRGVDGYRGRQNKTTSGKTCQAWNTKAPKSHNSTPDQKPNDGLEQNFCRNPTNNYLWCWIDDASGDWGKCAPLVKPACKGIEDCYETEFAEGCCAEMTVAAGYVPTDAQKKYGGTTSAFWSGKVPAAGAKASTCVSKAAADEYAGALTTGTAFTSNMSVALENIRKGDGGKLQGVAVADLAALWTLLDTDGPTQEALIVDLTCLKTAESAMKVAASATVALIAAALI